MPRNGTVSQQRNYRVLDVQAAKEIALVWDERLAGAGAPRQPKRGIEAHRGAF